MSEFDIPVVVFIYRRKKAVEIINQISKIKPKKLYLIGDEGRNDIEKQEVKECRNIVEQSITWECDVIKNYATENRGVYANIGLGAQWVFQREKYAIFLEDDNLPEETFFRFCKELLIKYEDDDEILWICGTNYLGEYQPKDGSSYMFTKHMLPCGWASWGNKFNKFYDGELKQYQNVDLNKMKKEYFNKKIFKQYKEGWLSEYNKIKKGERPSSWDYQMDFSIKVNSLYGISPCKNQIKNIGVDEYSTHGGKSFNQIMTKRFCGMDSYSIQFPLKHPRSISIDYEYEKKIANIQLYPLKMRIKIKLAKIIKKILGLSEYDSIKDQIHKFLKLKKEI